MTSEIQNALALEYIRLNAKPGATPEELAAMYEDACKRIHALYSSSHRDA